MLFGRKKIMVEDTPIYHGMNIMQRMHAAQSEATYVQKEKKASMNYSIVTHDAVTAKVRPVLHRWGVIYYPINMVTQIDGNIINLTCDVRFQSIDDPMMAPHQFIDVASIGQGIDKGDKAAGKAISYAVKYALLKAMGMATGDDADLDQDSTYESAKVIDLRSAIAMATTQEELSDVADELKQISTALAKREPASLQVLRQEYAMKSKSFEGK